MWDISILSFAYVLFGGPNFGAGGIRLAEVWHWTSVLWSLGRDSLGFILKCSEDRAGFGCLRSMGS